MAQLPSSSMDTSGSLPRGKAAPGGVRVTAYLHAVQMLRLNEVETPLLVRVHAFMTYTGAALP